jgi:hypothetical protein
LATHRLEKPVHGGTSRGRIPQNWQPLFRRSRCGRTCGEGDVLLTESHRNRLTVEDQSVRIIDEDFSSFRRIPPNTCFAVNEVNNEFRRRPSCLIIGILLAIEFCVLGAGSVFVSAWNIDGSFTYSLQTAVFMGLFWRRLHR